MTQSPATPLPPPDERRRLRQAASLTRAQVAMRVGVTPRTLLAWETGRSTPRGRKRETYAELLASIAGPARQQPAARAEVTGRQDDPAPVTTDGTPSVVGTTSTAVTAGTERAARAARAAEPKSTRSAPGPEWAPTLTPAQAFDALYVFCSPALIRQTYVLTGRRALARESVERAFQLAWQHWPEVARDPDPTGWVRAAAYDCALSPWHRFRLRHRRREPPPARASDRALMDVLLALPPPYRRTLLLHDGVGLELPETAAETEASTLAAANRLLHAREAVVARLPELSDPEVLHERLVELASGDRLRAAKPSTVRMDGERRARFWTRAAIAFTAALIGTTVLTLFTAPTGYEPPVPPGATVRGVPPLVAPGPLSEAERRLRAKLRAELQDGPERLAPQAR